MKKFSNYQYVPGTPMLERDKREVGSKFWNKGKWDNFVLPFLPEDCSEQILVDMGCNAGLFLEQAEKKGFKRVIGVDSDKEAIKRAIEYKKRNGGKYEVREGTVENCELPVTDYTVLANTHYYLTPDDWLEYLDRLQHKTRYCIIVTAKKKPNSKYAPSDVEGIKESFKGWAQVGEVLEPPLEGDPYPRKLYGLCFKSKIERVPIELDNGNNQQRDFLEELDIGKNLFKTNYYRRLKSYRKLKSSNQRTWSDEKLIAYMNERVALYKDVKKRGLMEPLKVGKNKRIIDGNHRHAIMKHLGYKTILIT